MYDIKEELLPLGAEHNRPGTSLSPVGVVIHETADPNATAQNEDEYFGSHYCAASAHYFVDDSQIIRTIPESEEAWHAGPTANRQFLGVELCHFDDMARFQETWIRGVMLVANMCTRYGWNPDTQIHSHLWVSNEWHEVDHTDPYEYFGAHNTNMDEFIAAVKSAMAGEIVVKKEDADEIITYLRAAYYQPNSNRKEIARLADVLRVASGQKPQNG